MRTKPGQNDHFALTRARAGRRRRALEVHRRDSAQEHGHHQWPCFWPISGTVSTDLSLLHSPFHFTLYYISRFYGVPCITLHMRVLDATHGAGLGRLCSLVAIGASLHKPFFCLCSHERRPAWRASRPRPRRTLTHIYPQHTCYRPLVSTCQDAQPFLISCARRPLRSFVVALTRAVAAGVTAGVAGMLKAIRVSKARFVAGVVTGKVAAGVAAGGAAGVATLRARPVARPVAA